MAAARDPAWVTSRGAIPLDRPRVLGILNVTPDSFFDGGLHADVETAVAHAERLLSEGADILDLGGESTRPGARPVSAAEELERVRPVLRELTRRFPQVPISIDTVKAEVARVALAEGASVVNDVSGLRLDPALAEVVAATGAGVVLMHSRGDVGEMASYATAVYGSDPVGDIVRELAGMLGHARAAGIADEAVVLDFCFAVLVSSLIGVRLFYVLTHLGEFHPWYHVFFIWEGGLTLYGGIILATATVWWFCRRRAVPFAVMADVMSPAVALGIGVTRIGCFLNGCCFGKPTELPWGVRFPAGSLPAQIFGSVPLQPSQLYSSLAGFAIAGLLLLGERLPSRPGSTFGRFLLLYGLARFLEDLPAPER